LNWKFSFLVSVFCLGNIVLSLAQPSFINVASSRGINGTYSSLPYDAGGMSFRDFDNDGWDDLTYCTGLGDRVRLFKNNYGYFEEINVLQSNFEMHYYSAWLDYDNDHDLDLFTISSMGGVELFENEGGMIFNEVSDLIGFDSLSASPLRGAAIGDFNNDGLLDVYICSYSFVQGNKMFFQNANHTFEDVTFESGTDDSLRLSFMGLVFDYNNDGWMDLYVANDGNFLPNSLFQNNGDTSFTDVSVQTATNLYLDAMGMSLGDYDGDLDLDIHITDKVDSKLLRANNNATYTELGSQAGVDNPNGFGWGTNFFDADLDGDEDIYITNQYEGLASSPSFLGLNDGQGTFSSVIIGADSTYAFTNIIGDFNNDRLPDIAVLNSNNQNILLWQNTLPTAPNRLSVKIEGCTTHRDAAGSRLLAYDGPNTRLYSFHISESFLGQNSDKEIIPILNGATLDSIEIIWPSGNITKLYDVKGDQTIIASECSQPKPQPVILVPNYATQGLVSCSGEAIVLELNGAYESVVWSTGDTTNSISVSAPGSYDVTVTNQFGVSATSFPVSVVAYEIPEYTIVSETPDCFNNGWVHIEPVDSTSTYTYQWSNGSTSNFVTNLNVGTYTVTISVDGECEQIEAITINQPQNTTPLEISAIATDASCFGDNSGIIAVNVTGGITPYTYDWTNNCTTALNAGINAGNYSVTVTDQNGCEIDTSFTIDQPDQILAYISVTPDTNESGLGTINLNVIGGTPPYAISWNDSLNQSGTTATQLTAGNYQVTIIDSNNCARAIEINVPSINLTTIDPRFRTKNAMKCRVEGERVVLMLDQGKLPTNLNAISLFDLQGRELDCQKTAVHSKRIALEFEDRGVFVIRDEASSQACKVVKL